MASVDVTAPNIVCFPRCEAIPWKKTGRRLGPEKLAACMSNWQPVG